MKRQLDTTVKTVEERKNGIAFFEIRNEELRVRVTNLGCHILSILMKDREGNMEDIVLGLKRIEDCKEDGTYMGAIVGRVANRIRGGNFTLNGIEYQLALNNGPNHLHGGVEGFNQKIFDYQIIEDGILFSYTSPDMEEGYPGTLNLNVTYRLIDNKLELEYEAYSDKDTLCNITNHTYFNLSAGREKIYSHDLKINADKIACVDANCCVTGKLMEVTNTPFDFRISHTIGERMNQECEQLQLASGYDHPFLIKGKEKQLVLYDKSSGRKLSVSTTLPTIQVYTGNFLEDGLDGKLGRPYENGDGVAIETQFIPDSIHIEKEPKVILKKGETYRARTQYLFEIEGK